MRFNTNNINYFSGMLQVPLPEEQIPSCERLLRAQAKGKPIQVQFSVKSKKRSLTANAALWAMLQELAVVLKTTSEELYEKLLRDFGFFEDIAIIPCVADDRLKAIYRIVEPTGDVVYGEQGRMEIYRCWRGSSHYNIAEFSHLLDMVIIEAKAYGIEFLSDADKDLLLREWEHGVDKN